MGKNKLKAFRNFIRRGNRTTLPAPAEPVGRPPKETVLDIPAHPAAEQAYVHATRRVLRIEDLVDPISIGTVPFKGAKYNVEVGTQLIQEGINRTMADWLTYTEKAKEKGIFIPPAPLAYAAFKALYQRREEPAVKRAQQRLWESMQKCGIVTLSVVRYTPDNQDVVTHWSPEGTESEAVTLSMRGYPSGLASLADGEELCKALFDTRDVDKVNRVFKWLSGRDVYVMRQGPLPPEGMRSSASSVPQYAPVILGSILGMHIDISGYQKDVWPAIGMRATKQE